MGIAPDSILGQAVSTVTQTIDEMSAMADNYSNKLSVALANIGNIKVAEIQPPTRLQAPTAKPPSIALGSIPVYSATPLRMPVEPPGFEIDFGNLDIDIGTMPTAPEVFAIDIPEAPALASIDAPLRPTIDTTIVLPDAPNITLPDMEGLEKLNIPAFEFPDLPTFDAVAPSTAGITIPSVFINWANPVYVSEVLDELKAQVISMMSGGTGLPPAVEDALFSRARERDRAETDRTVQEAVDVWAGRNFSMPPGMLVKQANVIREQGRLKAAETNRDIMVEAAKWEIENLRFAVQQGMALEQLTTNMFENMVKRLFEVAKFEAEARINVFNAQISLFNAQNSAFATLAQVYRTKLDGAISKLTAYKTAVEGQVAIGQINQQRVEVYKAKLDAVQSAVEVYKATVQGAQVRAETIKNQFDAYRSEVQAFGEQINAEKLKFDAYESRIKGEAAKAGMYDTQAKAYAATVQGLSSQADIKVKAAQLQIEGARAKVAKYLADVDGFKAKIDANLREVQYGTEVYRSLIEGWKAGANANIASAEMESRFADSTTRTNIAFAELQVTEYSSKMQNAVQQANIALDASKAIGQYTAQLASGAMSAAHVSASISGSGSANSSESKSTSTGTSYNYNY